MPALYHKKAQNLESCENVTFNAHVSLTHAIGDILENTAVTKEKERNNLGNSSLCGKVMLNSFVCAAGRKFIGVCGLSSALEHSVPGKI